MSLHASLLFSLQSVHLLLQQETIFAQNHPSLPCCQYLYTNTPHSNLYVIRQSLLLPTITHEKKQFPPKHPLRGNIGSTEAYGLVLTTPNLERNSSCDAILSIWSISSKKEKKKQFGNKKKQRMILVNNVFVLKIVQK